MIVKTQKDEKLELCKGLEFVCSRRKDHNGFAGKTADGSFRHCVAQLNPDTSLKTVLILMENLG
jgi:hypothetical protein